MYNDRVIRYRTTTAGLTYMLVLQPAQVVNDGPKDVVLQGPPDHKNRTVLPMIRYSILSSCARLPMTAVRLRSAIKPARLGPTVVRVLRQLIALGYVEVAPSRGKPQARR